MGDLSRGHVGGGTGECPRRCQRPLPAIFLLPLRLASPSGCSAASGSPTAQLGAVYVVTKAPAAEAVSSSVLGESEVTLGVPTVWGPAPRTPQCCGSPVRGQCRCHQAQWPMSLCHVLADGALTVAPAAMGLAALEVMHAVQRTWANAKVRTGGRTRPMQWRDMFDIAVKWRR